MISAEPTQPIQLMLVEDYRLLRTALAVSLGKSQVIQVLGAFETAEEALAEMTKTQPDVVIMDLGLPGMNGIEAIERIRSNPDWGAVKVVVLTSHGEEEEVIAALGSGANAYCLKEMDAKELIGVIQTVNEGATWLDPAIAAIGLRLFQQAKSADSFVARPTKPPVHLTEQEQRILELLVAGQNNSEIGKSLYISVHTVKVHVSRILEKLAVTDRVQAAVKAVKTGLVG